MSVVRFSIAVVCGVACAFVAPAADIRVLLKERAQTTGQEIHLGEVAQVLSATPQEKEALESVALGFSPVGDAERVLTRRQIEKTLSKIGFDSHRIRIAGAPRVRITALLKPLDPSLVETALRAEIHAHVEDPDFRIRTLSVELPGPIMVPVDPVEILPSLDGWMGESRREVPIEIRQGHRRLRRFLVRLDLSWEGYVAVARQTLPAGRELQPEDYRWVHQARTDNPTVLVLDRGSLVGMRLHLPVMEADALMHSFLRKPHLVRRGEVVKVTIRGRGFQLVTEALAQQHGTLGETVRVKNLATQRTMVGEVVGDNHVVVSL